jgi:site-specific DNA recombinase
MQPGEPIKYCLYSRKSSESDERQAMSIDSQIKEMQDEAIRDGVEIVKVKTESHSAKQSGQRKVFNEIIIDIKAGKYSGILAWAPDRLSRNAGDLGSLVDLMDEGKLKSIRTKGQNFSNSPNEKFLLMILCSQAKLENDNRRENVKRGIRSKCESGWMPCLPPMGYYNRKLGSIKDIVIDEERAPIMIEMFQRVANGESGRKVKEWFDQLNLQSRNNKNISYGMVYNSLKNPFYYGEFEYPKGSGKWYKGAHQPLINKDLFDMVQKQLEVPPRPPWGSKNFPFKRFLRCGNCGSSIVGEEKIMSPKKG